MKRLNYIFIGSILAVAACTPKEKSDKAVERERWIESLNDSVALYKSQIDSATSRLEELHDNVGLMLQDFEYVNNPREVEGYYIYKGWRQRYPLQGNGLVARISKDEGLELIACHKGAPFTSVALSGGDGAAVETEAVAHDQALNYRRGDLTTVCYYGAKADSVAMYISDNQAQKLTVTLLNGKACGSFTLSQDAARMISATWQLYSSQKQCERLEHEIPLLNRRIDTCRRILDQKGS